MQETKENLFMEFEEYTLAKFNNMTPDKAPVNKYDTYFKSFFIGVVSAMLTEEQINFQMKGKGN